MKKGISIVLLALFCNVCFANTNYNNCFSVPLGESSSAYKMFHHQRATAVGYLPMTSKQPTLYARTTNGSAIYTSSNVIMQSYENGYSGGIYSGGIYSGGIYSGGIYRRNSSLSSFSGNSSNYSSFSGNSSNYSSYSVNSYGSLKKGGYKSNSRVSRRRIYRGVEETYEVDGVLYYYDEDDEEEKVVPGSQEYKIGDTKQIGGIWYVYNGSEWVVSSPEVDIPMPIGDAEWWLILLLPILYCFYISHSVMFSKGLQDLFYDVLKIILTNKFVRQSKYLLFCHSAS